MKPKKKRGPKPRDPETDKLDAFCDILVKGLKKLSSGTKIDPRALTQFLREARPFFQARYPDRLWPTRASELPSGNIQPLEPGDQSPIGESVPMTESVEAAPEEPAQKPYIVEDI